MRPLAWTAAVWLTVAGVALTWLRRAAEGAPLAAWDDAPPRPSAGVARQMGGPETWTLGLPLAADSVAVEWPCTAGNGHRLADLCPPIPATAGPAYRDAAMSAWDRLAATEPHATTIAAAFGRRPVSTAVRWPLGGYRRAA